MSDFARALLASIPSKVSPVEPVELSKRLREHDDPRLYREADVLMSEAADEIDRLSAPVEPRQISYDDPVLVMVDDLIHEITGDEGEDDAFTYLRRALSELMTYRKAEDEAAPVEPNKMSANLRLLYEALGHPHNVFDRRHLLAAADEIDRLSAPVEPVSEDKRDAERYRWIRRADYAKLDAIKDKRWKGLDDAVDAAILAQQANPTGEKK